MEDIVFDRVEWKSRSTRKLPCFPQKKKKKEEEEKKRKQARMKGHPKTRSMTMMKLVVVDAPFPNFVTWM